MNQKHYGLRAVGDSSGGNVFDLMGLGVPGTLPLHEAAQAYHKKGNKALNYTRGSRGEGHGKNYKNS